MQTNFSIFKNIMIYKVKGQVRQSITRAVHQFNFRGQNRTHEFFPEKCFGLLILAVPVFPGFSYLIYL